MCPGNFLHIDFGPKRYVYFLESLRLWFPNEKHLISIVQKVTTKNILHTVLLLLLVIVCQVALGIKMVNQDIKMAKKSRIHRFVCSENVNLTEQKLLDVTADVKVPDTRIKSVAKDFHKNFMCMLILTENFCSLCKQATVSFVCMYEISLKTAILCRLDPGFTLFKHSSKSLIIKLCETPNPTKTVQ